MRWALWAAAAWMLLGSVSNLATLMKLAASPTAVSRGSSRATVAYGALCGTIFGAAIVVLLVIAGLDL